MLSVKQFSEDLEVCRKCEKDCVCKELVDYVDTFPNLQNALNTLRRQSTVPLNVLKAFYFYLNLIDPEISD